MRWSAKFPEALVLDDGTKLTTRASEEAGIGSSQVLDAPSELSRQAASLKTEVDRFLATVRAA